MGQLSAPLNSRQFTSCRIIRHPQSPSANQHVAPILLRQNGKVAMMGCDGTNGPIRHPEPVAEVRFRLKSEDFLPHRGPKKAERADLQCRPALSLQPLIVRSELYAGSYACAEGILRDANVRADTDALRSDSLRTDRRGPLTFEGTNAASQTRFTICKVERCCR